MSGRASWSSRPRGASLGLALLTLLTVFGVTAGVREAVATRTAALRQTLAAAPVLSSAVAVQGQWQAVSDALAGPYQQTPALLSQAQAGEIAGQLRGDLNQGPVRLAPASSAWTALTTTQLNPVTTTLPAVHGTVVQLEVTDRQPLRPHVRLLSGAFPAAPQPAPAGDVLLDGGSRFYPVIPVLVTRPTAAQFGLSVGSRLQVPGPDLARTVQPSVITFVISGIVAAAGPGSAFWTSDPNAAQPALQSKPRQPPFWVGDVLAGPEAGEAVQSDFGTTGLNVQWTFPLDLSQVTGNQAQPLSDALTGIGGTALPLSGGVQHVSEGLTASTGLVSQLTPFIAAAQAADVLLWLLYVSLAAAALAVLLLAARMVVLRRAADLTLIRARGASRARLAGLVGGEAALACGPAAAVAVALAVAAVPGAGGLEPAGAAGTWWPVAAVLLAATGGPALLAAARDRRPGRRPGRRSGRRAGGRPAGTAPRSRARPVAEVTLIAAAAGGLVIARQQGLPAGAGVNLLASAAPVLVAVPAVIVVFRLYPLVLRALLRGAARTGGAPAFLGLARAARTALTPALPAFALVLVLTVAAFGGMVRDAVNRGEVAASWATAGADAVITPSPAAASFTIPAAAARALAAGPGVTRAAPVYAARWQSAGGTEVTVLAVDPARYAALTAAAPGYPALPAAQLTLGAPGRPQPVLASAAAAQALGRGPVTLDGTGTRPVAVQVVGTLSSTPALPATAAALEPMFVIVPLAAVRSVSGATVQASELLLNGPGIDQARLTALVRRSLPGADVAFRSTVLAGLADAPLQHGAVTVITWSVVAAAVLGLAVMLLELALGAAERDATLARLAVMGLGEGQRARVAALELLPAVIASGLAAWACALVLPPLLRPLVDLSVFTGGAAAPLVPDAGAVAAPLAGLVVLAAAALAIEIGAGRRRGAVAALRAGG